MSPIFEFLLLALVPSGYICEVSCYTGDLGYIVTAAFRADWLATEGAVFDGLSDIVAAVTVIKRAHDLKLCLTAAGARCFIDNMVAGMALVSAFFIWNIFKSGVFFFEAELFLRPVHGNVFSDRRDKIIGVTIWKIFDLCSSIPMRSCYCY